MMIADASIRVEEEAFYTLLKAELGDNLEAPSEYVFGDIDVSVFDDSVSQMILLMTLAVMAYVDDRLHFTENAVLQEIKEKLDFSEEDLHQMTSIAERQGAIIRDAQSLFKRLD